MESRTHGEHPRPPVDRESSRCPGGATAPTAPAAGHTSRPNDRDGTFPMASEPMAESAAEHDSGDRRGGRGRPLRVAVNVCALIVIVGGAGLAIAGCSGTTTRPRAATTTTSRPASTTTSASSTTSTTAAVTAVLPLVACPTTFGVSPSSTTPVPSTISESVPSSLVDKLAVFTTQSDTLKILGPTGWSCSAEVGADGSTGVDAYPPGSSAPSTGPFQSSSAEAVVGSDTGGCEGCSVSEAAPLFPVAAAKCSSQFGSSATSVCRKAPTSEQHDQISGTVVGFLDPPGIAGDGVPSGGPYPANGVMIFTTGASGGTWLETCTLPDADHALCTASLNTFVGLYGGGRQ